MGLQRLLQKKWQEATKGILAGSSIKGYQDKFFTLKTVSLPRSKLAKDLEKLCREKGGVLTMEEFYQEELYGVHGYYASKYQCVLTNTPPRWARGIFFLCKLFRYHFFAELGPGDGRLALLTLAEADKASYDLSWGGVEIAAPMREAIEKNFTKLGQQKKKKFVSKDISGMEIDEPCLFIFPYGLDSISPEVFINTTEHLHAPTALLGVRIEKGVLREVILTEKEMKTRGVQIRNGIYTDGSITIDLSSWQLAPMQRAYIAPKVLSSVLDVIEKLPAGSRLCVIDEFRNDKGGYISRHLLAPRNLMAAERDCVDLVQGYEQIGQTDYYFPFYLKSFLGFLNSVGIDVIYTESEYFAAEAILLQKDLPKETKFPQAPSQIVLTDALPNKKKLTRSVTFPLDPDDLRTRY